MAKYYKESDLNSYLLTPKIKISPKSRISLQKNEFKESNHQREKSQDESLNYKALK